MRVSRFMTMLTLSALLAASACGRPEGEGDPTPTPDPGPALEGVWQVVSNDLAEDYYIRDLEYLELTAGEDGASGVGQALGMRGPTGVLSCGSLFYVQTEEDVVVLSSQDLFGGAELFFSEVGETTLRLTDERGYSLELVRATAVPPEYRCSDLPLLGETLLEEEIAYSSGLVWDGSQFWATSKAVSTEILPVNVKSGTVGTPITMQNTYRFIHAAQDGEFWGHTQREIIARGFDAVPTDEVDTAALGNEIDIRTAAYDGVLLYVAGYNRTAEQEQLLLIDSDAEPDQLISVIDLDTRTTGMVFIDGELWILSRTLNPILYRFNPETGVAEHTARIRSPYGFQSVGTDGESLYLVRNYSEITQAQLP